MPFDPLKLPRFSTRLFDRSPPAAALETVLAMALVFATAEPAAARFDATLGEFLLPYEAVRTAPDPDAALLAFLRSTYAAVADLAHWDRAALECEEGAPGRPRPVAPP